MSYSPYAFLSTGIYKNIMICLFYSLYTKKKNYSLAEVWDFIFLFKRYNLFFRVAQTETGSNVPI